MSTTAKLPNAILGRSCARWAKARILDVLRNFDKGFTPKYDEESKNRLLLRLHRLEKNLIGFDRQAIHKAVQEGAPIPRPTNRNRRVDTKSLTSELSAMNLSLGPTGSHAQANMPTNLQPNYKCDVCLETMRGNFFPQRRITNHCTDGPHLTKTCLSCLAKSIEKNMEGSYWKMVRCPTCGVRLSYEDVLYFAAQDTRERYDRLGLKEYLEKLPEFVKCRAKGCESGQLHANAHYSPLVICVDCGFRQCFFHDRAYHEHLTCAQVDARAQANPDAAEAATQALLIATTKICPGKGGVGCGARIEHAGGCERVSCLKCGHKFCFSCFMPYAAIRQNRNRHARDCNYHPNNVRAGSAISDYYPSSVGGGF